MEIDFSKCRICTPTGDDLLALYRMLMEVFVDDRPVFTEMIEKGKRFYTWTPHALYLGNEVLGNASLVPMRIWLGGQVTGIIGIASVGTPEQYRRRGIARYLVQHCLKIIDRQKAVSILLTELPVMYEKAGFKAIDQTCLAASVRQMDFADKGFECELLERIGDRQIEQIVRIYAEEYPNYDGKVVRDPDYWQLYAMLFNLHQRSRILFCIRDGRVLGYGRFDVEADRLLVSEICCEESATDVVEALLGFITDYALQAGVDLVTFALPVDHFARPILESRGIPLEPEPAGARRETFMVRLAASEGLEPFDRLQWSLADKF